MKPTKLLMICLLRSSAAALATPPRPSAVGVGSSSGGVGRSRFGRRILNNGRRSTSSSLEVANAAIDDDATLQRSSPDSIPLLDSGHIAFRLARRTDVPQIQQCNLATLPENYNSNFYVNHMRTWPELTLVAEHIPEGCRVSSSSSSSEEEDGRITPLMDYWTKKNNNIDDESPRKEIVGYILGKVEERPVNPQRQIFSPSSSSSRAVQVPLYDNDSGTLSQYANSINNNNSNNNVRFPSRRQPQNQQRPIATEKIGHVTSLAVHHHARRLGIASSLIRQLHFHLQECYGAQSIGLHVRISNKAAVRLYCDDGYDVADIIPRYYGDGEDAYFMRKDFQNGIASEASSQVQQQNQQQQQQKLRRGEKERNEWLNRDATRSGSFFDNRKSMRDTLSEEERAWVGANINNGNNNADRNPRTSTTTVNSSRNALSGKFQRSFRTFLNGGERLRQQQQQQFLQQGQYQSPPWETGPEGLRLPRYSEVTRRAASPATTSGISRGNSLRDLVSNNDNRAEENVIDVDSYEREEAEVLSNLEDAHVATGSV